MHVSTHLKKNIKTKKIIKLNLLKGTPNNSTLSPSQVGREPLLQDTKKSKHSKNLIFRGSLNILHCLFFTLLLINFKKVSVNVNM